MSDAVWRGSKAKLRRGKLKSRSKWSGERTKGQGKGQAKCKGGVSRHSRGIGWQPTDQTWLGQSAHLKLSPDIAAVLPPAAPSDEALARCRQAQEAAREAAASRQLARAYVRAGERGDLVEVERLLGCGVPVDSGVSGCCGHYPIIIGAMA